MSKELSNSENDIKTTKLIEHPDFFSIKKGDNYIAKICALCCYKDPIDEEHHYDYNKDKQINNYTFYDPENSYWDYPRHYISYIGKKALIIYKRQRRDCCAAKRGEIVVCVAYTEKKYRNCGLMTKLFSDLTKKYKHIVVDTYTDELITVCKKLGIKSFKGNF
ncbi:MAG: hypothetical protein RBR02_11020 [Desulfuromonadaceae bacterium]|nr:hypothetical protein [Desulfuromonadaceae bacterium]